jgi:hypothetical protein
VTDHLFESVSRSTGPQTLLESGARDDVHARCLLQRAQGTLQKWPEGFRGFAATVQCGDGHDKVRGEFRVFTGGEVEVDPPDTAISAWARSALSAISLARTPQFFKDGDGRFPITFEPEDDHPLGRGVRVHLGGGAYRAYRIDAKSRIRHQEHVEPTRRAAAIYHELIRACPGRVLPTRTHLFQWDVMTGNPTEMADIDDAYERRDHVWLPVCRRTTLARGTARRELVLELSHHAWL